MGHMEGKTFHIFLVFLLSLLLFSCSTTRVLDDGQYRLTKNKVNVTGGDKSFNPGELNSYIKQKPGSWNPLLCVYNWSGKKNNTLMDKFFRKIGNAPVIYDADLLESSAENIANHLEYIGYYGSSVDADIAVRKKKVTAVYNVSLGKRYVIDSLELSLPERGEFAADFLADTAMTTVRKGSFLSESALEKESERASARLKGMGYYDFSKNNWFFEADTSSHDGKARLRMSVREYTRSQTPRDAEEIKKFTFGRVGISIPEDFRIKESVLTGLNTVRPGEPYLETTVTNTYNRMSSLSSLGGVTISLTKADSARVDCDINLAPARQQGFKFNLEASSNSSGLIGISPELSFFHRNIFHGGEMLNLSFMSDIQFKPGKYVGSKIFGVSAGLTLPRFVGIPGSRFKGIVPRTEIKASYNHQDRTEYSRRIISASYGYSGTVKKLNYQIFPVQLKIVRLFHMDQEFYNTLSGNPFLMDAYQNHFDLGLGSVLYYTTNSDTNPKTDYHYAKVDFDIAGNVLSAFKSYMKKDATGSSMIWNTPYSQYVRGELTLGRTWFFGRGDKLSLATRLQGGAGYAYGNSDALPFEQHFFAGGANSLRGWQVRSVGPGLAKKETSFKVPNQSGDMKLEANVEFRYPLFWKFSGATFVDAGNIWTFQAGESSDSGKGRLLADTFFQSIAANWGLGLRLDLSVILVRLDMGIQIHDPAMDDGQRWISPDKWLRGDNFAVHFGVGYPF